MTIVPQSPTLLTSAPDVTHTEPHCKYQFVDWEVKHHHVSTEERWEYKVLSIAGKLSMEL